MTGTIIGGRCYMKIEWWMVLLWVAMSILSQYLMAQRGRSRGAHIRTGLFHGMGLALLVYFMVNPPPASAP